ncbi:MAG TPA: BON domain-containing protein [Gammaproteobacteria bacterium]|nr:BON domain-containing protein [Gammaproteobacteria bacterium]
MSEDRLVRAILAAFERDPAIDLHRDAVRVRGDGETLVLDGEVDNIAAKRRALILARETADTPNVLDRLRLRVSRERGDRELAQAVTGALSQEGAFRGTPVREASGTAASEAGLQVSCSDGVIRLNGAVASLSHRRLAEVLAWWVPGVADVDNRLHVTPPEKDSDDELTDALRLVLEMDPTLHNASIRCRARDRIAELEGTVRSDEQSRLAEYDCWYVPGIHGVRNALRTLPG